MEQVRCQRCNHRLYDISEMFTGTIIIKCPKCGTMVVLTKAPEPESHAPTERDKQA